MQVKCPRCGTALQVPDEKHYEEMPCPNCSGRFQVVTDQTQEISREFINEYLASLEKKPE